MVTKNIHLSATDLDAVKELCQKFRTLNGNVDCSYGNFSVDGKSYIGLLEMAARSDVFKVIFYPDKLKDSMAFRDMIKPYEV